MLLIFSDFTATSLKTLPFLNALNWSDENTLDLTSIKQLKGCRTTLVRDCLKFIKKLDAIAIATANVNEKNYALESIKVLIEKLKQYKSSCERYPRFKDFLNIIPDNTSGIVGFTIIAGALASIACPPLAAIPLFIFSWVLMDLFLNNRDAAKSFNEILFTFQEELSILQERNRIIQPKSTTPSSVPIEITASTSHSPRMYNSIIKGNPHNSNMNSPSTSFTPSL